MEKENVIQTMKTVLEPYALHDLDDVCERIYLDCQDAQIHPATILALAVEKSLDPIGGEDSFGDLTWRIGPHPMGLPHILIEMEYDNERDFFSTRFPLMPGQLERDFHTNQEGRTLDAFVLDYLDEQLDDNDRNEVWGYVAEDVLESVWSQEGALRIKRSSDLQTLLVDAITKNNLRGMEDALHLGAQINQTDEHGNGPLHIAAREGHHRLILPLIHAGARVDAVNNLGQSALHLAAAQSCANGCLVLLAHNADPKRKDNLGRSPIPEPQKGYGHEPSL